jgi:protein gp37
MNLNNKIGWCDATWNVYHGCKNTCEFCYARKLAEGRLKGRFVYENGFEQTFHPDRLQEPYHRKTPTKIFVSSMGDLFGDWMLPGKGDFGLCCINRILKVVDDNPQHTFQFLTKFPQNLRTLIDYQRDNMWVGTTVTCSNDRWRFDYLRRNVNGTKFVSFEPLLGDIYNPELDGMDWAIIGAETGNRRDKVAPSFVNISHITNEAECIGIPVYHKDNLKPHVPDLYVLRKNFPTIGGGNDV